MFEESLLLSPEITTAETTPASGECLGLATFPEWSYSYSNSRRNKPLPKIPDEERRIRRCPLRGKKKEKRLRNFGMTTERHWNETLLTEEEHQLRESLVLEEEDILSPLFVRGEVEEPTVVPRLRKAESTVSSGSGSVVQSRLDGLSLRGLIKACSLQLKTRHEVCKRALDYVNGCLWALQGSDESEIAGMCREVRAALQKTRDWAKQTEYYHWRVDGMEGHGMVKLVWLLKSLYWFLEDSGRRRQKVVSGLRRYGRRLDVCNKNRPVRV
jgi:hypothetical protein